MTTEARQEPLVMQKELDGPGPLIAPHTPAMDAATRAELDRQLAKPVHVPVVDGCFAPDSLEGYQRLAKGYLTAGLVPNGLIRDCSGEQAQLSRVALVLEAGMGGLRLTAIQSMSYLMVVNNRVGVWGDAIPGLIWRSGSCAGLQESPVGEGDNFVMNCMMSRMSKLPDGSFVTIEQTRSFGVKDARRANLWGKAGPWTAYPQRMLQIRARAFAARDMFPDALMGLAVVEELTDSGEPSPALATARAATDALPTPPKSNGRHDAPPLIPTAGRFAGAVDAMDVNGVADKMRGAATEAPAPAAEAPKSKKSKGDANAQPPADLKLGEAE